MTAAYDLPPRLILNEEGNHVAECRDCFAQVPVPVTHKKNERKPFALATKNNEVIEYTYGEDAVYDWSDWENHVKENH